MKYVQLLFLILPLVVYSQKRYNIEDVNSEPYEDDYMYDDDWYEITGVIYQEYEIGHLRYEHEYKEGYRDGVSKGWYANGNLKYIENYKDGDLDGWVKYWPLDHKDSSYVFYENGSVSSGILREWYRNKVLLNEVHYKNKLVVGTKKEWYENGDIKFKGEFKDGVKDGIVKTWHNNGQLSLKENYNDGWLNGVKKTWSPDGQITYKCIYVNGIRDGKEQSWHLNGQLAEECFYDGKITGNHKKWNADGQLLLNCSYVDLKLEGLYKEWSGDRKDSCNITYKDGMPWEGILKKWVNNNCVKIDGYKDGKRNGISKQWYSNGKLHYESQYVDGLLEGKSMSYFPDGEVKYELNYHNGKKHGLNKGWSGNLDVILYCASESAMPGAYEAYESVDLEYDELVPLDIIKKSYWKGEGEYLQSIEINRDDSYLINEEYNYENGVKLNTKSWFKNDQLKEETVYQDGKKDGLYKTWYENGQLKEETIYRDGKIDSLQKFWYKTGNKKQEISFKEGLKSGESRFWFEDGELSSIENYKNGVLDGLCIRTSSIGSRIIEKIETNYVKGKMEGSYKQFVMGESDLLYLSQEGGYSNNQKIGDWKSWYASGQPSFEGIYDKNGCIETSRSWYEDGQLKYEIEKYLLSYPINKERFLAKQYRTDGQIKYELEYEDGMLIHEKQWWYKGLLKTERSYKENEITSDIYWSISGDTINSELKKPIGRLSYYSGSLDLGNITADSSHKTTFLFSNYGDYPIAVTKAKSESNCVVVTYNHSPIMPGEKGSINVEYKPLKEHVGTHQSIKILVEFTADPSSITLYLKGNVSL